MFLIFTTQLYQYFSVFFLFALFSDKPEVFLPKYSQTAILPAAHFRRLVKPCLKGQLMASSDFAFMIKLRYVLLLVVLLLVPRSGTGNDSIKALRTTS